MHDTLTANAVSAGEPSGWSMQVLHRSNLTDRFDDDPKAALHELREGLQVRMTPDRLFALAELSFIYAEKSRIKEHYLAAVVYAYAFLFPDNGIATPDRLDPRGRVAADIYNLALSRGLATDDGEAVVLDERNFSLPFGELRLSVDSSDFEWGGYRLSRFVPVGEFEVRGLRNRYRQAGIGVPLAAEVTPSGSDAAAAVARKRVPPRIKVPVTAFVRIDKPRRGVIEGKLRGRIELFPADLNTTVKVNERNVPLELEYTAVLGYALEGSPGWDFEIAGFRFADQQKIFGDGLIMMHPYRTGRIPVVFVHGTASSPLRWAEMLNELTHDPAVKGRYQFWLFQYNTGQPILYSALLLRRALHAVVADLDPNRQDPALRRMVIVGHSQGGLLTRLMASSSDTRFWDAVSSLPFDEVEMASESRQLLRDGLFFDAVPTVERVVFIATPHRGSYQATGWVLSLVRWLVRLPGTLVYRLQDLLQTPAFAELGGKGLSNSVENMSPGSRFLQTLEVTPMDPRVNSHSIIAVLGDGPVTGKTDGVVAYESAHIAGVTSEKIVRSGHSTQSHPETIQEVRRILRAHLEIHQPAENFRSF